MCPVVFSGANQQRRCRCIPRELGIPITSSPVKSLHHCKLLFNSRRVPSIAEPVPNQPTASSQGIPYGIAGYLFIAIDTKTRRQ